MNTMPEWRNGRRFGLKNRWGQPRTGSSPVSGTSIRKPQDAIPYLLQAAVGWFLRSVGFVGDAQNRRRQFSLAGYVESG